MISMNVNFLLLLILQSVSIDRLRIQSIGWNCQSAGNFIAWVSKYLYVVYSYVLSSVLDRLQHFEMVF